MRIINLRNKEKRVRVMCFGTFDLLHPGHLSFLRQAKMLGDFLIVSIARDANVKKIKGTSPLLAERDRRELVANLSMVDQAVFGDRTGYLSHVLRQKPDIIALGYDQAAYVVQLKKDIAAGRLHVKIVRLKPHHPKRYKSALIKKRF
ncbi:MAG: adenylyltransferase/cytidyltransferase family protein [bacterium]|nr:adenylyltransferase/cytidyltransferase family protein [bacterium]